MVCALLAGGGIVLLCADAGVGEATILSGIEYDEYVKYRSRYAKLDMLIDMVEENYYQDIDESDLFEGAYKGMVEGIGDPYSEYVPAQKTDEFFQQIDYQYTGIGMVFFMNTDGDPEVESVYVDSPADKAGIRGGDILISVDGVVVHDMDSNAVRDMVRGAAGTSVALKFKRGNESFSCSPVRAELAELTVSSDIDKEANIGYIAISGFGSSTAEEFAKALSDLENAGVKGLIVDLRYNGGGLVDAAVSIGDMLMNKGMVAYAEDKYGNKEQYTTEDGRTSLPYVVLVNEYTASASEILAVGIQDNNEGKIVGVTTYGKGIIQSAAGLVDGSALKLTIMEYYSPSGKKIHKVGVVPDVIVPLTAEDTEDVQLIEAEKLLTGNN